ncbi:metallophosphoesterase [uncultured Cedecea sp.]|uniref:metallophosphoesterase n=1 Tax=uncultured Cedecea sp. TaxID=988762 RepID=UPI00262FBF7E|nr:metallophosphoesterase [uncultured Cedecea sp.]
MKYHFLSGALLLITGSTTGLAQSTTPHQVAFMPDIHFHDVYGEFKDGSFHGLENSQSGKQATIRTMYAQLTSTRLFNENYFALRAALDDAGRKGVKIIALPGDFSDDGQSVHLRGLVKVLHEYEQKYGMRFFATPGNHDPNRPFDMPGGKSDYLGEGGRNQAIYSRGMKACKTYSGESAVLDTGEELPVICSEEVAHRGYEYILGTMADFGLDPREQDIYWETPYSNYKYNEYSYAKAQKASLFAERQYEICAQGTGGSYRQADYGPCFNVTDSSYLVEPVPGLWLMAVDANVYLPKTDADPSHASAVSFSGSGDAGYNKMLTHKQQTIAWMASVAKRAKEQNKTLLTFSHFPMVEFDNGAAPELAAIFGKGKFQLKRAPQEDTSHALAKTGIGIHIGGHMHFNDTGVRKYDDGSILFNIQAPSMAAYVPAYKIVSTQSPVTMTVKTVVLDKVPQFNELFEHYQTEWDHLQATHSPKLWNKDILQASNYYDFTNWHIRELARLRFIPDEWPCAIRQQLFSLNGADMLILSQLDNHTPYQEIMKTPLPAENKVCDKGETPERVNVAQHYLQKDNQKWLTAQERAEKLAHDAGMQLADFSDWDGYALATDVYRLRNADELALADISPQRLRQYQLLTRQLAQSLPANPEKLSAHDSFETVFRLRFASLFSVIDKYLHGAPSKNFSLNTATGEIHSL